jgi:flagellar biosynthesis/type III secretory pathway M-ring protein FliF/YscJ
MKAAGLWIWNVLKMAWWAILLVVGAIFLIGFIRKNRKEQEETEEAAEEEAVSYVQVAKQKVTEALTDVKVEQAIIKEKSKAKKKELEEIRKEPDGKERRKKLASILKASI